VSSDQRCPFTCIICIISAFAAPLLALIPARDKTTVERPFFPFESLLFASIATNTAHRTTTPSTTPYIFRRSLSLVHRFCLARPQRPSGGGGSVAPARSPLLSPFCSSAPPPPLCHCYFPEPHTRLAIAPLFFLRGSCSSGNSLDAFCQSAARAPLTHPLEELIYCPCQSSPSAFPFSHPHTALGPCARKITICLTCSSFLSLHLLPSLRAIRSSSPPALRPRCRPLALAFAFAFTSSSCTAPASSLLSLRFLLTRA